MTALWTRRHWLARTTAGGAALTFGARSWSRTPRLDPRRAARLARQQQLWDPTSYETIAAQAVDAARAAGAHYADARITRTVGHKYLFDGSVRELSNDVEITGVGVRALVNGYWGFAACPWRDPESAVAMARAAVAQAKLNASGPPRTVELSHCPPVRGRWTTPIRIDPFQVSVEEKLDYAAYWEACANAVHLTMPSPLRCRLIFMRQERVLATSEGTLVSQTVYDSMGDVTFDAGALSDGSSGGAIRGLERTGKGWEMVLDAKIPEQIQGLAVAPAIRGNKGATVGRSTIVCDGGIMALLLDATLGLATQLDRALGYEADHRGTSYLDDPLGMLGEVAVAAPMVTVTANRSAPAQLATVQWDDEGVVPTPFTIVTSGILTDFQTTREQASWLAPYYAKRGRPVQSHGCAAAETALLAPLQMTPNLSLEPGAAAIGVQDLVADVSRGILITRDPRAGVRSDFQAKNGMLKGRMQEIRDGRLGAFLDGGTVQFTAPQLWKSIATVAGPASIVTLPTPVYEPNWLWGGQGGGQNIVKGEPIQSSPHSVQAAAATIVNQAVVHE